MKKYYDAVIVGCGVAGCFAALHLPQEADIVQVTHAAQIEQAQDRADIEHIHQRTEHLSLIHI